MLPGSRRGESARHLPALLDAVDRLYREQAVEFRPAGLGDYGAAFFRERIGRSPIQVIEGESWDAMAHADLALAASGTVTVEAALLGTPMVTFYKVTAPSWVAGKLLVRVPFYSMVNLIAGRADRARVDAGPDDRRGDRRARRGGCCTDDRARARDAGGAGAKCARSSSAGRPRTAAPRSFRKFWKDKLLMFRNRWIRSAAVAGLSLAAMRAGPGAAPLAHRRGAVHH